jgi:hypothetical protein
MTKKTTAPAPAKIAPPTRDEKVKAFLHKCKWEVEGAEKVKAAMAENFSKKFYDATYQIEWLQGKVETLEKGAWYSEFLEDLAKAEGDDLTVEVILQRFISSLQGHVDTWYPQNSTSAYSNAASGEKFQARRELLKEFRGALSYITKENEVLV